ncbi:cell wall-binding repeat-containing protein [Clostridium tetani]|uniref:N-acetylmuramoyl-L-alanine amidase n=1 Tax=Clostridium tetani TaxID=1513 RepID=A0ABY0ESW9_CLOTA|nr:cell wall-binding repeat-containing protein [Clostridium tetani]KHO36690.1 N-acetylmuramoyl-L-alanine amidase [Clostridium tetani]RXI56627.1 N-acetylmuramoyl-L-alanine amidase [Clostridium tetani]RXI66026.1 N-acetylmuramoyl-L-alanine amidase [Clostridium tetani]CDI50280.1 N-acetylmuramoyl-L-alanine amidase [Clostridium tetani 12124569]
MGRKRSSLKFLVIFLSVFLVFTAKVSAAQSIKRFGGSNRYETSVKISQNNWSASNYVILVSGEDYPDALTASPLSKKYNAPILLTQSGNINSTTLEEIKRLNAENAIILGGPTVVSESTVNVLKNMGVNCTRIYGKDRYETSVKVAKTIGNSNGIFIASGAGFADAVSAAPIAASRQMPIILTSSKKLPDIVRNYVRENKDSTYYVVGGNASVNSTAVDGIIKYKRLSGQNRYETNSVVINEFVNNINFSNTYLASGQGYADALSGSAVAGKTSSPIILVNSSNTTNSIIKSKLDTITTISVLGGTGVISDTLVNKLIQKQGTSIKVCIDAGHGGYDPGAIGPTGVREKDVTLAITLKVGRILKQSGIDVVYTRTSDSVSWPSNETKDLQKRCDIANNANVQYFVSIHANSASISNAKGTEVYYSPGSTNGEKLAKAIQDEVVKATNLYNRGVKTANFYVLRNTNASAALVETGFISNPKEEQLLKSDAFQEKMAQAIAKGVLKAVNN